MASKRRLRRRECTSKTPYNATAARAAAYRARRRTDNPNIWAYKCHFCAWWHIGRTPDKIRQAAAQAAGQR